MLVTIKSIYINDKKKDGTPNIDKNGHPFKRVVLITEDGKTASLFVGSKFPVKDLDTIMSWKAGDQVDIVLEQSGDFLNFKLPSKTDVIAEKTNGLAERVDLLEKQVAFLKSFVMAKNETRELQKEIKAEVPAYKDVPVDQIPF